MKRFLYLALCLLIALSMTLCFVACDDEEQSEEPKPSSSSSTAGSVNNDNNNNDDEDGENNGDNTGDNTEDVVVHEHTFATEYSYDEENHYYAATCEHSDEKSGVEAHSYDAAGNCKCGYFKLPEITSVAQAIEIAKANAGKLVTSTMTTIAAGNYSGMTTYGAVWTEFNDDFVRIIAVNEYVNQYFYAYDKNGDVFGVFVQVPFAPQVDENTSEESMKGYRFTFDFADDYETAVCGVEAFIEALYNMALASAEEGTVVGTVDNNSFTFSLTVNDTTTANVVFTVNEEGVISNANIAIETTYEYGTSYEYDIEQSTNNKSNPFDPESVKIDSYVITDKDGNDVSENVVNVEAGTPIEFFFTEVSPVTADFNFANIEFKIVDQNGEEPYFFPFFNEETLSYFFTLPTPGTYTVTILVNGEETVTTVEIPYEDPTSISAGVYNPSDWLFEEMSEINMYVGKSISIKALVGEYEDGSYVAEILGEIAETVASLTDGEEDGEAVKVFTASEVGTYTIKLTSTKIETLSCELTVNVLETPDVAAMLNGYYKGTNDWGMENIIATFTPETETTGTVEITYQNAMMGGEPTTGVFSYAYADGAIAFEYVSGDDVALGISVNENYELVITAQDGNDYILEKAEPVVPSEPVEEANTGSMTITALTYGQPTLNGTYTYEINEDGAFVIYKDGEVVDNIFIGVGLDGNYTIQVGTSPVVATLVKQDGAEGALGGTYTAIFNSPYGSQDHYSVVFTPDEVAGVEYDGQIIVTDNIYNGRDSGTYDYVLLDDGTVVVYKDGEETNAIIISIGLGGGYQFQCPGLRNPIAMEKTDGSDGDFVGKYSVNGPMPEMYVIEITGATVAPEEPSAITGTIDVVDNNNGRNDVDGQYTFEYANGVFTIYKDGVETSDVQLAFDANGNLTFAAKTSGGVFNVATKQDDSEGLAGEYWVNFVMPDMWVFTITVDEATGSDDEENAGITAAELAGTAWQYGDYMMILEFQSETAFYLYDTSYAFELVGTYTVESNTIVFDINEEDSKDVNAGIPLEQILTNYEDGSIVMVDSFGDLVFSQIQY
ncbi:MAG: hypothetical protein J6D23_01620 [Clostridia bacterium]|nr:hypothetical protein [Clostridia bacterium]